MMPSVVHARPMFAASLSSNAPSAQTPPVRFAAEETTVPKLGPRFQEALQWAFELHRTQTLKGGGNIPYYSHLMGVASIALKHGADEEEAMAALLHDAVEDQGGRETLAQIERRFGPRVAEIVAGCSDSETIPKPPWKERKEAYIAHIREASESILLVSASDKLYNARAILDDLRQVGNDVWKRFKGGKEGSLWYYQSLVRAYRQSPNATERLLPLFNALEKTVVELTREARR